MPQFNVLLFLVVLGLATACTPLVGSPHSATSDHGPTGFTTTQDRLRNVGLSLLVAAAELCKAHVQYTYGFDLEGERNPAGPSERESRVSTHGEADENVTVEYVHPTLSAGAAGLRAGASVLSVDDINVKGKRPLDARDIIRRVSNRREGPLRLIVHQNAAVQTFDLDAVPACDYPVLLVENESSNAFADGRRIAVTTGMMRLAASDAQLAFVVGHEIAHNALEHPDEFRLRTLLDALVTAMTGRGESPPPSAFSFPKELEADADYVGLYLVARAGYDLDQVGQFWSHLLNTQNLAAPAFTQTHPTTPERVAAFKAAVDEIHAKIDRHEPLLPRPRRKE